VATNRNGTVLWIAIVTLLLVLALATLLVR